MMRARHGLAMVALGAVLLAAGVGAAPGDAAAAGAKATKYLLLAAGSGPMFTSSGAYVPIPGLSGSISVGGRQPTCITATLSAHFSISGVPGGGGHVWFRVVLDGTEMEPGQMDVIGLYDVSTPTAFVFWLCDVVPGQHGIEAQWRITGPAGDQGVVTSRTLVVEGR